MAVNPPVAWLSNCAEPARAQQATCPAGVAAAARRAGSPCTTVAVVFAAVLSTFARASGAPLASGVREVNSPPALSRPSTPVRRHQTPGPCAASQNASPPGSVHAVQPVFRTGTVLVEVDVSVHDRQGRFVDDLGPADFTVYEEGVPQRLERVLLLGTRGAPGQTHPGAGSPALSDRLVSVPRVIILVVDDGHLSPEAFLRVRRAAMAFLDTLQPEDVAGVVVSGRTPGDRLTTDKAALKAALAEAVPSPRVSADASELRDWPRLLSVDEAFRIVRGDRAVLDLVVTRACDDEPVACRRGRDTVEMEVMGKSRHVAAAQQDRARASLRVWQAVADGLQRFDGPKTVVLLTEGFAVGDEVDAVGRIVDAAWRGGVTFYAVDARGAGRDRDRVRDLETTDAAVATLGGEAAAWQAAEDAVNAVAADSGGYVARYTNDVTGALARIARDRNAYYLLVYSPSKPAADGTWRRLRVEVAREGVTVRARRGYVASPAPRVALAPAAALRASVDEVGREPSDQERNEPAGRLGTGTSASETGIGTTRGQETRAPGAETLATAPSPGGAVAEERAPRDEDRPARHAAATPRSTPDARSDAAAASAGAGAVRLRPGTADRADRVAALAAAGGTAAAAGTTAAEREARIGWAAYERGDVEGARRHLEAAAASGSAPPWVHYALGQAAFATSGFVEAAAAWERVRAAAPEFKPVYFDLVDVHLQLGQSVRALRVLEDAGRRWPDDTDVLNATGVIHLARGSVEAAIGAFERAVAARPDDALGHYNLARAYEIRFGRSARFVRTTRQWYRDENARRLATLHYRRHIELGGAFARQAQEGLARLEWAPRDR